MNVSSIITATADGAENNSSKEKKKKKLKAQQQQQLSPLFSFFWLHMLLLICDDGKNVKVSVFSIIWIHHLQSE